MPGRPANEPVRAYAIAEKGWGIEGERDLCPSHVASRSEAHEMEVRPRGAEVGSVIRAGEWPSGPRLAQPLEHGYRTPAAARVHVRHGGGDECL